MRIDMRDTLFAFILSVAAIIYFDIPRALAQTPSLFPEGGIEGCDFAGGEISADCVPIFLAHLIKFIFGFAGAVCLFMIIFAGYQIAISSLSGQDTSPGKQRIVWAIIGFIVCALAFFIIDFVISTIAGL